MTTTVLGRRTRAVLTRVQAVTHPALRATLRRALVRTRHPQHSLVSVVVPFYNVEAYLGACLTSIVQQSYRRLQIILVDDGSRDSSLAIARSYARWDPRITIVRQPNKGLGAARNTGAAAARGHYLCFVDSDDTLPRNALSLQVRTLEQTGSDFVVGSLARLVGRKRRMYPWVTEVHSRDRLGITLDEFPDILRNVFAWNKLYVREFFDRVVQGFPEGIRYEDQEATARAYVAGRFDVLRTVVYNWRKRDDGTSLTQQKSDPLDLADRLVVKQRTSQIIANGASRTTFQSWMAKAIGFDLRPYFEQVPRTDLEFWHQLRRGVLGLAERMDDEIWGKVALVDRIPALAALAGHREDVVTFVTRRDEYGWSFPGVLRDGVPGLDEHYLADLTLRPPPRLLAYAAQDVRLVARVTDWEWTEEDFRVVGTVWLTNLPAAPEATAVTVTAVAPSGVVVEVPTSVSDKLPIDQRANDSWNSHAFGAFEAVLPVAALNPDEAWTLEVTVTSGSVRRRGRLAERDLQGRASVLPVRAADAEGRWVVSTGENDRITLRHRPTKGLLVRAAAVTDHRVTLAFGSTAANALVHAAAPGLRRRVAATPRPGEPALVDLDLPPLPVTGQGAGEFGWRLTASVGDHELPVAFPGDTKTLAASSPGHGLIRLQVRPDGTLLAVQRAWNCVAYEVALDGTELVVSGRLTGPATATYSATLANESHSTPFDAVEVDPEAEAFRARLDLARANPNQRKGYSVSVTLTDKSVLDQRRVRLAPELLARFPLDLGNDRVAATLSRRKGSGSLWVQLRRPYRTDERGRLAQRRLHVEYQQRTDPLRDAILFESFNGKSVTDSPLALCTELRDRGTPLELFWTVDDLGRQVPEGATPLLVHSRRWMQVLGTARYLVNNTNFPFYFRKRDGQVYVQTWHGTPLKRIGNDVPASNLSLPYRQLMTREPGYWDYLLAQNDFAAQALPTAFDFGGRVLNEGYPRNDDLLSNDSAARRFAVRRSLGLTTAQCAILYAPTWRDTVANPGGGYSLVQYLDPRAVKAAFGARSALLLRGHANTAASADTVQRGVVNVTEHPSINDLMLAADVLVTDYSSVMFDFCVTGKPMIFLAPDLAEYRDRTRGFYLDFAQTVPGPVCRTTDEVVRWLRDLDGVGSAYADRYTSFRQTYAPQDDGHASKRVVDAIWGSL